MSFAFADEEMLMTHPLPYELLLFDADGTLRRCRRHSTASVHAPCHNGPGEWELIPGVPAVLAAYDWRRVGVGLASNQAGIALRYTTAAAVEAAFASLIAGLFPPSVRVMVRYAPDAPDASSYARKPSPWMLLDLIREAGARCDQTVYIGDSDIDAEAAMRAGIAFCPAWQFFGWTPRPLNAQRYDMPGKEP